MEFKIPNFKTDKELFDFLVENEEDIFYSKKQSFKKADGFVSGAVPAHLSFAQKNDVALIDKEVLDVVAIINTTKVLDSHGDVHIDGLWDKSLKENKFLKHVQEHKVYEFDKIISDKNDLNAYVKNYSWKELGYNYDGETQALVFESKVRKSRNQFMHKQYAEGNVDNHSVGMRYVKLVTCINDEEYQVQFENWEKYAPMVVNQEALESRKYFWAVLEAKAIEGSAVPLGSNSITPTQSVKSSVESEISKTNKEVEAYKNWLLNN